MIIAASGRAQHLDLTSPAAFIAFKIPLRHLMRALMVHGR